MTEVKPTAFGPASAEDLALDAEAQKLVDESLGNIRKAAADWEKTIASVTGVLGIVALIKGREDISELPLAAEVLIGLFIATGLLLAIRSIMLAALAAQGTPSTWWAVGQKLKEKFRSERELAAQQLMRSRSYAVGAALCLIVAVGIAWYTPEEESDPSPVKALVTFTDRAPICGDLAAPSEGLAVAEGKQFVSVSGGNVTTMNVVSTCPKAPADE